MVCTQCKESYKRKKGEVTISRHKMGKKKFCSITCAKTFLNRMFDHQIEWED